MVPVILMEPDSAGKRRHFAATLLGPKGVFSYPTTEEIKEQLRELRHYSVGHLESLVDELVSWLTSGRPIAANKSAAVTKGLARGMVATNPDVIDTCYVKFKRLDTDIRSR